MKAGERVLWMFNKFSYGCFLSMFQVDLVQIKFVFGAYNLNNNHWNLLVSDAYSNRLIL